MERINTGLTLDEVLNYAYESPREMIPYDRIDFALIDQSAGVIAARWARSEALRVVIGKGYRAPYTGSLAEVEAAGQPRILPSTIDTSLRAAT